MTDLAEMVTRENGIERITVRVPQALAMLGLGRSKLYELIGDGEIEIIKVGKSTLIVVASLHAFVQKRRIMRQC